MKNIIFTYSIFYHVFLLCIGILNVEFGVMEMLLVRWYNCKSRSVQIENVNYFDTNSCCKKI